MKNFERIPHLDDRNVPVRLQRLLDVPQQMLLIHAGGCVDVGVHLGGKSVQLSNHLTYFSHVVEVPVRNRLLLSQLPDFVEEVVQLVSGLVGSYF